MPTLAELSAKVDELQTKLDAEQEQIAAVITQLQTITADLQAQLDAANAAGGTDEERQAVMDKLNAAIADLEATIAPTPQP
jgi:peptidoglycan hydrolase CwlO-like protein